MTRLVRRIWTAEQDGYLKNNFKGTTALKMSKYLDIPESTVKDRLKRLGCVLTERQKRWHYLDGITEHNDKVKEARQPKVHRMFPNSTVYALMGIYEARKKEEVRNVITPEGVLEEIALLNKVTLERIRGFNRSAFLVFCRQAFCRVAERILNLSDEQAGTYINRDRTTVMYHRRKAARFISKNDRPFMNKWTDYLEQTKYLKIKNNG